MGALSGPPLEQFLIFTMLCLGILPLEFLELLFREREWIGMKTSVVSFAIQTYLIIIL